MDNITAAGQGPVVPALAWAGTAPDRAQKLSGDASTRNFLRIPHGNGTAILMIFQDDETSRWQAGQFIKVREWLRRKQIPVPEIIRVADNGLWFMIEDLGDLLLENWLPGKSTAEVETAYHRLTDYCQAMAAADDTSIFRPDIELNAAFLEKELLHFHKYFCDDEPDDRMFTFYKKISHAACAAAMVPVHRDYHSRNVLVCRDQFYLIDFQDARWGNPLYDIGSLLYEAYVPVAPELRRGILARFGDVPDLPAVVLQRSLKAVGTFAFQKKVRNNPFYLQFIPRCLGYAKEQLADLGWDFEFSLLEKNL